MAQQVDDRKDWELRWCVLLSVAMQYVPMLNLDERRQRMYSNIYDCNHKGITEWARDKINGLVREANDLHENHKPLGSDAASVGAGYVGRLRGGGYAGAVMGVTTRKGTGAEDGTETGIHNRSNNY